jgi:hypothetical protein
MANSNYNREFEPHGSAGFEPIFGTHFAADENSMMDFKNESFGSDWDANRPFEQDIISPSSLHSFNGPRMATAVHSKWANASSKEFDQFDKGKSTDTAEPSPRVVADSLPFRDRFASAAMVSQQANASFQLEESFRSQEDISPKQLFSSPIGDKSSGPLSPVHNNDEEYVSFGNQSVFSDITEFEMSTNASCPSASRDLRRKARQSRNIANRSPPRQHLGKVPEDESAKGMRRESDTSMESESDPDNEKNISVRLASFFANRSSSNSSSTEQGEGRNLPLRHRGISENHPTPPSSASESSNGYIAWPGTLDQNDNTVIENSSYASAEDVSSSKQSLATYNKAADATAKKWLEHNTTSVPEKQRTNAATVEPSRNDKIREDQPVVSSARSRVEELKKRFEERNRKKEEATSAKDIVDLDVIPTDSELPTPSDYHLAAAISKAKSSSKSYRLDKTTFDSTIPEDEVVDLDEYNLNDSFLGSIATDEEDAEDRMSGQPNIDTSASLRRVQSAGKSFANIIKKKGPLHHFKSPSSAVNSEPMRLSEAALRHTNQLTSTFQSVAHGANVKGYRGFFNKIADVPNLMDDLESVTSASTVATNRKHDHLDSGSDVFDGVCSDSSAGGAKPQSPTFQRLMQRKQIIPPASNRECTSMNIVKLNGTMSSIQTSPAAFEARRTSLEFDAALTESDTDYVQSSRRLRGGNAIMSGQIRHHLDDESASYSSDSALDSQSTDISISKDLSSYAVGSGQVRKLVKAYRNMSQFVNGDNISQKEEDAKKAFALFEMRSRIMATDIERGFDRAGGTVTVDDLVLTQYFRASCRVRDAVIVSKAWRDGASPQDARTALNLIEGHEYYIKRSSRLISSTDSETSDSQESLDSTCSKIQISYERVDWIDDTEFSLIRCLGANTLRGSGIFTVGDCQSMLLKLTHEHCEVSSYVPPKYFTNGVLSFVLTIFIILELEGGSERRFFTRARCRTNVERRRWSFVLHDRCGT